MSRRTQLTLFLVLLTITALACGLENIQIVEPPNLELTITAQALILLQQTDQAQAAVPGAVVVNPPAANATAANPPAENNANPAAAGPVTVTVSVETNCRKGPGVIYASAYSLPVGQVAEVVGKNTITNYWIIKIPGSGSTCWLWGKYATVSGNTAALVEFPTFTPGPPTATIKPTATAIPATATTIAAPVLNPPSAPSNIKTVTSCADLGNGKYSYDGTVLWNDNSNDEAGFRINIFDAAISVVEVGPDIHGYTYSIPSSQSAISLSVEAFNNAGSSQSIATSVHCP